MSAEMSARLKCRSHFSSRNTAGKTQAKHYTFYTLNMHVTSTIAQSDIRLNISYSYYVLVTTH